MTRHRRTGRDTGAQTRGAACAVRYAPAARQGQGRVTLACRPILENLTVISHDVMD